MRFVKVVGYKQKMMFSDRMFFAAMILIPLFITVATGYALRYEKLGIIPVALVDEDGTVDSQKLSERLKLKEGLRLYVISRVQAMEMLENGKVEQIFVIRTGFSKELSEGNKKGIIDAISSSYSYTASYTAELVAGEVMRMVTAYLAVDWVERQYSDMGFADKEIPSRNEMLSYNDRLWQPEPLMTVKYQEIGKGSDSAKEAKAPSPVSGAASAGIITAFLVFYMLFSSGWLVEERTNGTLRRLASINNSITLSFAANIIVFFAAGYLQLLIFTSVLKAFFGVNILFGAASLLLMAIYLLSVISLSLFISSFLKTASQLQAAAPVIALSTSFAGGCFWNFIEMPRQLELISMLTPQGWVLRGLNTLSVNHAAISGILAPLIVLSCAALIFLLLSYIIIVYQKVVL